jgi:hypothetical protein
MFEKVHLPMKGCGLYFPKLKTRVLGFSQAEVLGLIHVGTDGTNPILTSDQPFTISGMALD